MILIFIHGWSVTSTDTYGELPAALKKEAVNYGLDISIKHIYLGKYISFHDEVEVKDIARAFDTAIREQLPNNTNGKRVFSCITHSTGGPVIRQWVDDYYKQGKALNNLPLKHLVMLAPANHGSPLAVLGKKKVGRIKAWFSGVEPGQRVLDMLSIGSDEQWDLNLSSATYKSVENGFFPFVLTGQGIDRKFYDFINNYLDEDGSDGVVRVSGANMNYKYYFLEQSDTPVKRYTGTPARTTELINRKSKATITSGGHAIGVFKQYSHSGSMKGIMGSVKKSDSKFSPIVKEVLSCLKVKNNNQYLTRLNSLSQFSDVQQEGKPKYSQIVFSIHDDYGRKFKPDDFDILLLGGKNYQAGKMPKGFLKDKQINSKTGRLVFYINHDQFIKMPDNSLGIRVVGRPDEGFSYYKPAEFRLTGTAIGKTIRANETTYLDISLKRYVDKNVMRLGKIKSKPESFKDTKPSGHDVS